MGVKYITFIRLSSLIFTYSKFFVINIFKNKRGIGFLSTFLWINRNPYKISMILMSKYFGEPSKKGNYDLLIAYYIPETVLGNLHINSK